MLLFKKNISTYFSSLASYISTVFLGLCRFSLLARIFLSISRLDFECFREIYFNLFQLACEPYFHGISQLVSLFPNWLRNFFPQVDSALGVFGKYISTYFSSLASYISTGISNFINGNFFTHSDGRLQVILGVFHQVAVQFKAIGIKQQHNRRPSKGEITHFLALLDG